MLVLELRLKSDLLKWSLSRAQKPAFLCFLAAFFQPSPLPCWFYPSVVFCALGTFSLRGYSTLLRVKSAEKAMATCSSTLAWKIPWMEEPGRLQSMGSLRVGHDWATLLSLFTFMHWRRKWQPSPVFLPGESQGWRSLVGCCLWGRTESDTTEVT